MDSNDLTREQAGRLSEKFGEMAEYLGRVRERMEKRRFPPDDRLLQATIAAHDALRDLRMVAHYSGLKGVGR